MRVNWIVKASRCLGLSVQSATLLPLPSPSALLYSGSRERKLKKRMICYIRAIQTAVWRHYQLNSLGSCFPVKLVWNQITARKNGKTLSPPDKRGGRFPRRPWVLSSLDGKYKTVGGNKGLGSYSLLVCGSLNLVMRCLRKQRALGFWNPFPSFIKQNIDHTGESEC